MDLNITTPPGIITQDQFNTVTSQWLNVLNGPDVTVLQESFALDSAILAGVSFPASQLIQLVSAVGIERVKAKFGILTDETTNESSFAVILFATDINNERISSYYINADYRHEMIIISDELVPDLLAQTWLTNWTELAAVEPELFETSYGTLQGYTFDKSDFIRTLIGLDSAAGAALNVRFGLHQYYQDVAETPVEVRTFGLILQMYVDGQPSPDAPFYDISMPCPTTC